MGSVDHHAVEPGGEAGGGGVAGHLGGQGGADILGQILGLGALPGEAEGQREDPIIVARQQAGKGSTIAICRCPGQIFIACCHAHHDCWTGEKGQSLASASFFFVAAVHLRWHGP